MKKNMKKLAVGFGVFVMAVGSLMDAALWEAEEMNKERS